MTCLDDEAVLLYVQGQLAPAAEEEALSHVNGCPVCRTLVAEAAKFFFQPEGGGPGLVESTAPSIPTLAEGTSIGRYRIERPLGAGAGGVVYCAFDPQLKRKVALKIVRPAPRAGSPGRPAVELLREAEAMARLSHPNVVRVFDAGTHGEQVFLVMELVEGETLRRWLDRGPRPWPEVVGAFVAAARGLAAAHAAGLVHRDFKPDNVLVGRDGEVRVTDFGLARPLLTWEREGERLSPDDPSVVLGLPGTAAAGTPLYMAPEQFDSALTNPRTDQFSFCVALFLALHGHHPFRRPGAKSTPREGPLPCPPTCLAAHPAALDQALRRGLDRDPAARHPSLEALIEALEPPRVPTSPRPRRALRALGLGGLLTIGGGLAFSALFGGGSRLRPLFAPAGCGNGRLDPGEECDDGNGADDDACTACRWARCGDGRVRRGVEECDDAADARCRRCLLCEAAAGAFVWEGSGHCYTLHREPLPWPEARAACEARGGTLVTFLSAYEGRAVQTALFSRERTPFWIGLAVGRFGLAWLTGEPPGIGPWNAVDGTPSATECVRSLPRPIEGPATATDRGNDWATAPCAARLPYVCERAGWVIRPADGHAYKVFHAQVGWAEARQACIAIGAHLVTLTSADENAFAAALTNGEFWMAGTDSRDEGRFRWETGEPFSFSAFAPGEPDGKKEGEDFLLTGTDELWHDRGPRWRAGYVCEMD